MICHWTKKPNWSKVSKLCSLLQGYTKQLTECSTLEVYIFRKHYKVKNLDKNVAWISNIYSRKTRFLWRSLNCISYFLAFYLTCDTTILDLRGVFNKFPDFFVQAFKIVGDSWKFSMLLLYILWDDWLIFMLSGSKEQLQQQLEYTLLKTDCHSWWISKMQSGREDTLEERYAIKFCFKLEKIAATETYGMLQTAFKASCMNRSWVFEWYKRFKEGRKSVRDDESCGRSKEVDTPELSGQRVRVRVTMWRF